MAVSLCLEEFIMNKENVSYELMIDLLSNMVKKYMDNNEQLTKDGDNECLSVE
jgi:hypothetical protein